MNEFSLTMEAGEEIVFGPVTSSKTTSISGGAGPSQGSVSRTVGRTVGVTNRRVIIEDSQAPDRSQAIPNDQVQMISIKRKQVGGQETITIASLQTASGDKVKVDLPGIDARQESLLRQTFPSAQIGESKGLSKGATIAIVVVAGLAALCCFVTFGVPLILRLFNR